MPDFEQQWAIALQKTKQRANVQKNVPLSVQKKQVKEELQYYKSQLSALIKEGDGKKIEECLKKNIDLRARQTALLMRKIKEQYGFVSKWVLRSQVKKYYEECHKLINSVEILLKRKHEPES